MIKKPSERAFFYVFPFAALILFTTINFSTGNDSDTAATSGGSLTLLIRFAIYVLALYPFIVQPSTQLSWLMKRWPFLLVLLYVPLSILWSAYPSGVVESTIHFVGGALGAFAASIYFSKHHGQLFTYLSVVFGIAVITSLATVLAVPEIGLQNFEWEDVTRWRGATGNANSLGRISALTVWVNVIGLLNNRDDKKLRILHIVLIVTAIVTLIGSGSKTSMTICLLLVTLVYLSPRVLGRNKKKKRKLGVLIAYFVLLIVSVMLIFSYKGVSNEDALSKVGRDSTYSGRTYIWKDATTLINLKPIVGWSFDGRRSAFDKINIGVPHFHNGYLDFMVRGGMAGFIILLMMLARTFWRVFIKSKSRPYIYPHLAAFLLTMLIYNLSEVSFGSWADLMWTMFLFIYFLSERSSRRRRRIQPQGVSIDISKPSMFSRIFGFSWGSSRRREGEEELESSNKSLTKKPQVTGLRSLFQSVSSKNKIFYPVILVTSLLSVLLLTTLDWKRSDFKPTQGNIKSPLVNKDHDVQKWRGIVFAPDFKTDPKDYVKKFEQLVTEALAPLGINLIIFDMHWNNYKFVGVPGLAPLERPPFGVVDAEDAKRMADICRDNGIRVMVGMNFLTHQSHGQLLKAFPQYQWPGNEKLWDPLKPGVNQIAFKMADELVDAFDAEGFHVGIDEGWGFNAKNHPQAKNYTTAELFAKAINEYHVHFVKEKGIEMIMWSDMLEGKHTNAPVAEAISMIPKDIVLASWDYECHWKRYPGFGRFLEKFIPICPWDSKGPAMLADSGFRVMVSPWRNPRAARKLAESTKGIQDNKLKGILYTTWSSEVVYSLKDALLVTHSNKKIDPTIVGISEVMKGTVDLFTNLQ